MYRTSRNLSAWLATLFTLAVLVAAPAAHAESGDVLGAGDSIRVTVFENPDLTTETRIAAPGTIRMPLIGEVDINGLTSTDAAGRIAKRLHDGHFLKDPQVTVSVLQIRSRQISVLGQVARPGRYALEDANARLTDVLALAGGITATGDDTVTVMTTRDGKPARLVVNLAAMYRGADPAANIELHSGDTIFVQRAPVFYIYGEVQHAGAYRLDGDLNVMQAISLGGGVTPRGTERGLSINRRTADGGVARIDVQPSDLVKPDDVIYVKESLF
ncbi:MAG: polysaccharide export protein EpsE [Rhodocyclaceae bacterium]|nr:polysaccharide export protein EpsE [Rhodocyclaceae bacterium]